MRCRHGFEDLAADVVEVHVDAVRSRCGELIGDRQLGRLVVDRRVEAQFVDEVRTLGRPAGDADDSRAAALGDLGSDTSDGPGCRRHHHGVACLRSSDVEHSEVAGEAGHAEQAEVQFHWSTETSHGRTARASMTAVVCTPRNPVTTSPTSNRSLAVRVTGPMLNDRITSPGSIGGM